MLVGRPKRWAERFALIVAPRQFRIPPRDNLVQLDLPLMRADPAAVAAAGAAWRERLASLPHPLTAVLVGGETKPFRFDGAVAATLLEEVAAHPGPRRRLPLSLHQPADASRGRDGPRRRLPQDALLYRWDPATTGENPYLGLLAHADRFVVTGDSISMMVEVASLGKPLAIFALPVGNGLADRLRAGLSALAAGGTMGRLAHLLHRLGIAGYARDLGEIRRRLIERGLAVPLGQPFRGTTAQLPDELAPVVARIRALLA